MDISSFQGLTPIKPRTRTQYARTEGHGIVIDVGPQVYFEDSLRNYLRKRGVRTSAGLAIHVHMAKTVKSGDNMETVEHST